ncbi:DUF2384 domain-containing protein [Vibrio parahaemolyticus]
MKIDVGAHEKEVVDKAVKTLLRYWRVTDDEAASLLGKESDLPERQKQLLAIHRALRLLYPHNPELLYVWIRMRNSYLDDKRPLDLMLSGGQGFDDVIKYLNHSLFK